jgi:tetratricopeptide (TPR) repeat protein
MSRRHYYWTIIIALIGCASLFQRTSEYEKGLAFYKKSQYSEAIKHFSTYYSKHSSSDTTLYYLYDCYTKLNDTQHAVDVLARLAEIGSTDENVYLNLIYFYRKLSQYEDMFTLLSRVHNNFSNAINQYCILTRRFYAEIICGATSKHVYTSDPLVYAVSEGYMPICPDGMYNDDDRITQGQLIILLDRLLEPSYPKRFYNLTYIANTSFLYLPYMRLIDQGILPLDAHINPDEAASALTAITSIGRLKEKGLFD